MVSQYSFLLLLTYVCVCMCVCVYVYLIQTISSQVYFTLLDCLTTMYQYYTVLIVEALYNFF
jgi:hypothetical protein